MGPAVSRLEPRFKAEEHHQKWDGWAKLYWNDQRVESYTFDQTFLLAHGTHIMRHVEPDGTGIEYHVLSRADCLQPLWTDGTLIEDRPRTRAEVDAFEGIAP